jgi:hypothetical protein
MDWICGDEPDGLVMDERGGIHGTMEILRKSHKCIWDLLASPFHDISS